MSADNWTICPKCKVDRLNKIKTLERQLHEQYGQVSEFEYNKLKKELKDFQKPMSENTLREDYEIGIWNNKFYVCYGACCGRCGFEYEYSYGEPIIT